MVEAEYQEEGGDGGREVLGPEDLQFSTFYIGGQLFGVNVTRVQEIVRPMLMTTVPLAPSYVRGLINLRGQVATAIGLRELFEVEHSDEAELMNIVCKCEGNLISFQVDEIGDVVEVSRASFETTPHTISPTVRRFMAGVYKTEGPLLSILNVDRILEYLNRGQASSLQSN